MHVADPIGLGIAPDPDALIICIVGKVSGGLGDDRAKTIAAKGHRFLQCGAFLSGLRIGVADVGLGQERRIGPPGKVDDIEFLRCAQHAEVIGHRQGEGIVQIIDTDQCCPEGHTDRAPVVIRRRNDPSHGGAVTVVPVVGRRSYQFDFQRLIIIIPEVDVLPLHTVIVDGDGHAIAGIIGPDGLDVSDQRKMPLRGKQRVGALGHGGAPRYTKVALSHTGAKINAAPRSGQIGKVNAAHFERPGRGRETMIDSSRATDGSVAGPDIGKPLIEEFPLHRKGTERRSTLNCISRRKKNCTISITAMSTTGSFRTAVG